MDEQVEAGYIKNPLTGYKVKIGSKVYKTLIVKGVIPHPKYGTSETADDDDIVEGSLEIPVLERQETNMLEVPKPILKRTKSVKPHRVRKALMKKVIPEMIPEAKKISNDLSDEQVDELLKKMLYTKLCGKKTKAKRKPVKKRKSRKKKVYVESSSESESESSSE